MGHVDLDAARAAREETLGENPLVTFGGRDYKLTLELYVDAASAWRENRAEDLVRLILADPSEADDFLANRPTWSDLSGIFGAFKVGEPGESGASSRSSKTDGRRSRPTSDASTDST